VTSLLEHAPARRGLPTYIATPRVAAALCLVGSLCLALAGCGSANPRDPRDLWFGGDTPLGTTRVGHAIPRLLLIGGLLLLLAGWLILGLAVQRHAAGTRAVLVVTLLAALPLLLAPPLTSSDGYSYIAIGQLVRSGHDPYSVGWAVLGRADYARMTDPQWAVSPAPYSPLALRLLSGLAALAGGDLLRGVALMRVIDVLALAACTGLLLHLARRSGRAPAPVLWLAVANPLVLLSTVSAVHLDVLMVVGLLAAIACHRAGHPLPALVLVGLAAQVKVVALLLALVLAADLALRETGTGRRIAVLAGGLATTVASFSLLSAATGLGWGWLRGLSTPGRSTNSFTPIDAVWDLLIRVSLVADRPTGQSVHGAPDGPKALALLLAAALAAVAATRVRTLGVERASGLAFAGLVLLGGIVWPWYLLWPLALLALGGSTAERVAVGFASAVLMLSLLPSGVAALDTVPAPADVLYLTAYAGMVLAVSLRTWRPRGAVPLDVRAEYDRHTHESSRADR